MTSNNNFVAPGQVFTNDWTGTLVTPKYTTAQGLPLDDIVWYVNFAQQIPSTFDIFVFSGSTIVDSALAVYSGGTGWDETRFFAMANPNATYAADLSAVPEPGTMMLLGAGFLGLVAFAKRRKNA